jgi:hypothetical protein
VTGWRKLNSIAPFTANRRAGLAPLALPEAPSRAVLRGRLALLRSFFLHHWRTGCVYEPSTPGRSANQQLGWLASARARSLTGHEERFPRTRLSAGFSIAADVKPRPDHLIPPRSCASAHLSHGALASLRGRC